ncbi:helix-turn-helix transcriptional regulator [Aestuariimicrobium sp. T2.26MG-19.2B]|uniref:helix-turn-helix transcriptional regulator n=1 Tax=Aestuariimicrobium sp. T2.26MG-19.2B TaxID=3040679 RepID=UPI0024778165|nr:LuxR family transcriptional regulator [Aestuariimicrobium sp. T2.26MG-19.2B]CAI9403552.1 HTH-type transcriptional regulator MalT [Aestuariimicrobium sp. T2.26MG-19.2B]
MVGRSAQLAVIDDAVAAASAGRGGLVLVTGEAGIGKTMLGLAGIERAAAVGLRTAHGFAVDDTGAPALWPWSRLARQLPELDTVVVAVKQADLDNDAGRFGVAEAVVDALTQAAEPSGLLVLLEDLHWADSLSVAVLRHVAFDLPHSRVVVLATARDDAATAFGRALPDLLRGGGSVLVRLTGLDAGAVAQWLSSDPSLTGWGALVHELVCRTDGNPFFIHAVTSQAPPASGDLDDVLAERQDIRGLLAAPLLQLTDEARDTLITAALMSERLSPTLLAAACGRTVAQVTDHIAQGCRAGLLQHRATGLSFTHALVRDAVIADTEAHHRSAREASIAAAMQSSGDELLVGPSAVHWDRAEGHAASVNCRDAARAAAARAAAVHAHEEAVAFARMCVRHTRRLDHDDAELAECLVELAGYEWLANQVPAAVDSCVEAVDVAEAADRPDRMARAALVPQGIGSREVARVVAGLCRRALSRVPPEDLTTRARLTSQMAVAAAEDAVDGSADALSVAALTLARRSHSPTAELDAIAARHLVLSYPQTIDERVPLAERAVELGRSSTTAMGTLWGHLWQADIALQRGDLVALDDAIVQIARVAGRRSSPVARWHEHRLRGLVAAVLGDFDGARTQAEAGLRIADRTGDRSLIGMYHIVCVQMALLRGDPGEITEPGLRVLEEATGIPLVRASLARALALAGDRGRAVALLATLADLPERVPVGPRWMGTLGQIGLAAAALDDPDLARRCHALLAPTAPWYGADGGGTPFYSGSNEYPLGVIAVAAGQRDVAADHFSRAITENQRIGARPYVALARLGLAECLEHDPAPSAGHRSGTPTVRELAAAAAEEFRLLDMPGPLLGAERLLARPAPTDAPLLTTRELQVARLVGQAHTNRQIADQLVVSVRTVESHVRSALAKLGFSTRTELALWVRARSDGRP